MYRRSTGEKIFTVFNYAFMAFMVIVTLYPCLYVLFASVSDPVKLYGGSKLLLWPRGFTTVGYEYVLDYDLIWTGYKNTFFYVVSGTTLSVFLTIMAAYCLSRRNLVGQNLIIFGMVFTNYFWGGMIPTFLVVRAMHILDTPLAIILPGVINTTNFIISLTYFRGMPYELEEASKIDGATNMQVLFKVLVPLAKPVIFVMVLYYAVALWNDYMSALLYLNDQSLFPLQYVLQQILVVGTALQGVDANLEQSIALSETIKYAIIVVSTIPILCVYPFIQRHFVKGVMVGAIKG